MNFRSALQAPEPHELPESVLIHRIVQGERELFRHLVEKYQGAIWSLGMGFFRNAEDSRDFSQEVFLKAFTNLDRFEGRARFSTWLYRIAYNTAINSVNRRKEYQSLSEDAEIPDFNSPERDTMRQVGIKAVRKAVEGLPERYRICVDLFFFHGLPYGEIEEITGFPVNTIKSHVFRAKTQLRQELEDFAEGV